MNRCIALWLLLAVAAAAETVSFEPGSPSSFPAGWFTAMTHEGGAPKWEVLEDRTAPSKTHVLAQTSSDPTSGRFPLAIHDEAALKNGEIHVKFKPISGRVDQAAGLVWRYRDENNYYIVRANALENNVVLYRVEQGKRTPLAPVGKPPGTYGVEHAVPSAKWSSLGVVFENARFRVVFDGQPLFEVNDSTFGEAGKVGLWTKADSVTYFDDFEILSR